MFNEDLNSLWDFFFFCAKWKQVVSIVMSWYIEITEIFNKPPGFEVVTRCFQFPHDNFYSWVIYTENEETLPLFQQNKQNTSTSCFFWTTTTKR